MMQFKFFTLRKMQEIYVLQHEPHVAGSDVRRDVPRGAPNLAFEKIEGRRWGE